MDAVLREMERKHRMEQIFLSLLLLDNALDDLRDEARQISEDERQKRLAELKDERDALDLDEKGSLQLSRQLSHVKSLWELRESRSESLCVRFFQLSCPGQQRELHGVNKRDFIWEFFSSLIC